MEIEVSRKSLDDIFEILREVWALILAHWPLIMQLSQFQQDWDAAREKIDVENVQEAFRQNDWNFEGSLSLDFALLAFQFAAKHCGGLRNTSSSDTSFFAAILAFLVAANAQKCELNAFWISSMKFEVFLGHKSHKSETQNRISLPKLLILLSLLQFSFVPPTPTSQTH